MSDQISTGISELDQRLGGVAAGRYYLLTGTPGAGKTSACLHFLAEGLRNGERCAILTQENPDDLFAQAEFIGHDFRRYAADEQLAVVQYRLDFSNNYARVGNARAVTRELAEVVGETPSRLVVDSILPFVQAGGVSSGAVMALLYLMEEFTTTAYFTVPGDLGDTFYARLYDPLVSGTAGILHFEMAEGDVRQIVIRKVRQTPNSTAPLRFLIRGGIGIVELDEQPPAPSPTAVVETTRRVALINSGGRVGGELFAALGAAYELETFTSVDAALPHIDGGFSVLALVVDPLMTDEAIAFVRAVRKGTGVPIVMLAESEGLRASTRARALRAGADEVIAIDSAPQELFSRIEGARARGHRSTVDRHRRETLLVQPRDSHGRPVALPEAEIARGVRHQMNNAEHPFFALVCLVPPANAVNAAWTTLASGLRLREGDLIAVADTPGQLLVYLHDISRRHAAELMNRLIAVQPQLETTQVVIDQFPADAARVEAWLRKHESPPELRAAG